MHLHPTRIAEIRVPRGFRSGFIYRDRLSGRTRIILKAVVSELSAGLLAALLTLEESVGRPYVLNGLRGRGMAILANIRKPGHFWRRSRLYQQ